MACWISVVRFVPDPAKGEFINVAAIAGNDQSEELEVRAVANWTRAKQLDAQQTLWGVMDFVSNLQTTAELAEQMELDPKDARLSREAIERMSAEMQNIVQLTRPIPVRAASVDAALELAFSELIVDPAQRVFAFEKKFRAVGALKEAYKAWAIPTKRDATVQSGPYKTQFDFAVANGKAVQLARCWSFQLPNQRDLAEQVRAWAWGVRAMRTADDASARFKDAPTVLVPENVDVEAVFIPPKDGQGSQEAFEVALDVFNDPDARIVAVPVNDAPSVAKRAAASLQQFG